MDINKFKLDKITYLAEIYGDINDVIQELSANSFITVKNINLDTNNIELEFKA